MIGEWQVVTRAPYLVAIAEASVARDEVERKMADVHIRCSAIASGKGWVTDSDGIDSLRRYIGDGFHLHFVSLGRIEPPSCTQTCDVNTRGIILECMSPEEITTVVAAIVRDRCAL